MRLTAPPSSPYSVCLADETRVTNQAALFPSTRTSAIWRGSLPPLAPCSPVSLALADAKWPIRGVLDVLGGKLEIDDFDIPVRPVDRRPQGAYITGP